MIGTSHTPPYSLKSDDDGEIETPNPSMNPESNANELPPNLRINPEDIPPGDVDVDVPSPKGDSFISGLIARLHAPPEEEPPQPRRRTRRGKTPPGTEAYARLISVCITILATALVGEALAPNDDEAAGMASPLARILARHVPATGMTDDAVDLLEFASFMTAYYVRIRPHLKREAQHEQPEIVSEAGIGGNGRGSISGLTEQVRGW